MKKKHLLKIVVAFVLCAAMVLPFVPITAEAEAVNNFDTTNFEGLNFSLVGDSISTYAGVNNNATYNPDYYQYDSGDGVVSSRVYYTDGNTYGVTRTDTWWQQAVDTLNMNLLVNNAWSGSAVLSTKGSTEGAYIRRSAHLHNGSVKPDIIALYLGTNDCSSLVSTSTVGAVSSTLISNAESYVKNGKTTTPATIMDAYAIMLYRAIDAYPDAEIYCFTLLPEKDDFNFGSKNSNSDNIRAYLAFNAGVKALADHYDNVHLVDLFNDSGIHQDESTRDLGLANNLHPNAAGMDAITNCLISSMIENSKYMGSKKGYSVDYDLGNSYVAVGNKVSGKEMYGDVTAAIPGKPFSVELASVRGDAIDYTVTMGGKDITTTAVSGNTVTISNVTGDISIKATALNNYSWQAAKSTLQSNPTFSADFTYSTVSLAAGAYNENGNFNYLKAANAPSFKLSEPVYLRYTRPWVMEFTIQGLDLNTSESVNGGFQGGILLTSDESASNVQDNLYIHLNQTNFYVGYCDDYNNDSALDYRNTGYGWDQIASAVGSTAGDAFRNSSHTYRLENKIESDGTNMIYLTVDGKSVGAMNNGESAAADLSCKDMVINYLGTSNHPLQATKLTSFKVYENGTPEEDAPDNFRWAGVGESLTSAESDGFFTYNLATLKMGSGVNGVHEEPSYYSLQKPVTLLHNRPWTIEWRAKGDWGAGDGESPMLLASVDRSGASYPGAIYLWRNSSGLIAFGYNQGYNLSDTTADGVKRDYSYNNYGIDLSSLGMSTTAFYVYRLQNEITYNEDGSYKSNMVYLYVDDVKIGPMNNYHQNVFSHGTTSDWLNGKDMAFSYMGTATFPISGVTFDYIQIWENGYAVDTLRLEYLINNRLDSSGSYDYASWMAYNNAINAGKELLKNASISQDLVEAAVDTIMATRSQLITNYTGETKIYSAELVTGDYVRLGKQTGIKVVTTPDVAQVCVGSQTLIVNSSKIQKMIIDGVETEVKVWLVTFNYRSESEGKELDFGIGAWRTYSSGHQGTSTSNPHAYLLLEDVHFSSNFVTAIQISSNPTKTEYYHGEKFDPAGMTVQIMRKNSTDWETVTDYQIVDPIVSGEKQYVTVEYEGAAVRVPLTVVSNVSDLASMNVDASLIVEGYYVGIADEGLNSDKEILFKDTETDSIIAVRFAADITNENYTEYLAWRDGDYTIGEKYRITCALKVDGSVSTPNKQFLSAAAVSKVADAVEVSYLLNNTVTVSSWEEMQALFQVGTIKEYTYIKFTGDLLFHEYSSSTSTDKITGEAEPVTYRLHMNADASGASSIKPDEERAVGIRANVMEHNLGEGWLDWFFGGEPESGYPGTSCDGSLIAVYTGGNGSYFQLTILDDAWVDLTVAA